MVSSNDVGITVTYVRRVDVISSLIPSPGIPFSGKPDSGCTFSLGGMRKRGPREGKASPANQIFARKLLSDWGKEQMAGRV